MDVTGSTKVMADYVEQTDAPRFALFTECSMGDNLAAQFPNREMVRSCSEPGLAPQIMPRSEPSERREGCAGGIEGGIMVIWFLRKGVA